MFGGPTMEPGGGLGRVHTRQHAEARQRAQDHGDELLVLGARGRGDKAWWTMAVARTPMVKKVQGGWSRMLRDLLRLSLGSPSGMQVAGIPVVVKGELITTFARVVCLLSDGDGLRQALQWHGASSLKP